jgi:uracil-DNA glycosylase
MLITMMAGILHERSDLWSQIPSFWQQLLVKQEVDSVSQAIGDRYQPELKKIFRAIEKPVNEIKVLILGQDPYPNSDYATGLAFSVPKNCPQLPASLKNIYQELQSDLNINRYSGDLSDWADQGVMLLNRSLSIGRNGTESHRSKGWNEITQRIVKCVADSGAIGVLWGNDAQQMSSLFNPAKLITSPHPSPLSAYRGFFGSKPFSKVNQILIDQADVPIKW